MIESWLYEKLEKNRETPKPRRGIIRDVTLAAVLAALVVVLYPSVEPLIPWRVQSNITAVTAEVKAALGIRSAPANTRTTAAPEARQRVVFVAEAVNFRATPSTGAEIITTLQQGLEVALLEQRSDWTRVRINSEDGVTQPREGWVYSSFLEDAGRFATAPALADGE